MTDPTPAPAHPDDHVIPDGQPSAVDSPQNSRSPSLPRFRRELGDFQVVVRETLEFLRGHALGKRQAEKPPFAAAIIEAAYDQPCTLTLDSDQRTVAVWRAWKAGKRPELTDYAIENVELLFRIVHSAIATLRRLEAVGYSAPNQWSNLPPGLLARNINAFQEARTQQLFAWKDPE